MSALYDLKPFQKKAKEKLLSYLADMKQYWEKENLFSWTCLKAPTGAGKTVIAGSVIDSLLNEEEDFEAPKKLKPVIIWVCEKSLLQQSRNKLDNILQGRNAFSQTEIINEDFLSGENSKSLKGGKVYFLETQLLGGNKRLSSDNERNGGITFWKILENTLREQRPIYCFIDEAHRGFKGSRGRLTIRQQIIVNIPFVIGISATEDNFVSSKKESERQAFPVVEVPPEEVRKSGLLKSYIDLFVPALGAAGEDKYDQYLERAIEQFKKSREAWDAYNHRVKPLLVIQLEPKSAADASGREEVERIGDIVKTIKSHIPDLPPYSFAHVLSERGNIEIGGEYIAYIKPEEVQIKSNIAILFAKEAISNGWDCPRAEVFFSRCRRKDPTYIAQFLGRMVRTPLGYSTNEPNLDSVFAMLPDYDKNTVQKVVDYLTSNSAESKADTHINPEYIHLADPSEGYTSFSDMEWQSIMEAVSKIKVDLPWKVSVNHFHLLQDICSLIAESKEALSEGYSVDWKWVTADFAKEVELQCMYYEEKYRQFYEDNLKHIDSYKMIYNLETEKTERTIDAPLSATPQDIYRLAQKTKTIFTKEFVNTYLAIHSDVKSETQLIFVASNEDTKRALSSWAKNRQQAFWENYRKALNFESLSHELQEKYQEIAGEFSQQNNTVETVPLHLADEIIEAKEGDSYEKCLYQGRDGKAHLKLNNLETKCIKEYLSSSDTVAFFRNPSKGNNAFRVLKADGAPFYPDFIFFGHDSDGSIKPYVVDPHGDYLEDSLSRLKGAVKYLKNNPKIFSRWLAWNDKGDYRNLIDLATQEKVEKAKSASEVYS